MNKFLLSYTPFTSVLTESTTKPGVFQRANAKNQNGRVYSKLILERECQKYKDTAIQENRAYGELDHPNSTVVELKNASHIVTDLWWDGDDVIGKAELLNTPAGNIVKEILAKKYTIGISSRGTGNVKSTNEGTLDVQDDFELICFDFVSDPSTHGAYMSQSPSLNENTQKDKYYQLRLQINEILNL